VQFGRGLVGAFLAVYVVVIGVPIARVAPIAPSTNTTTPSITSPNNTKPEVKATQQSTTTNLKVELGADPGTLVVSFPPGTKEIAVIAAVGPLGLSIIRSDVTTGAYVLGIPSVRVYMPTPEQDAASDKAWILFPRVYSSEEIDAYLGANKLKLDRWASDPETSDRFAVVDVPRLQATLVDAQRGLYSITLASIDDDTLQAWARESGVRIVQYDRATGEALVQPLDWVTPTPQITVPAATSSPAPIAAPSAAPSSAPNGTSAPARTAPPKSELIPGVGGPATAPSGCPRVHHLHRAPPRLRRPHHRRPARLRR